MPDYDAAGDDFDVAAALLATAADETGKIGVDRIVYLNAILGIHRVTGNSEYDVDGTPTNGAIHYARSPVD